jgi:hypothetical protein
MGWCHRDQKKRKHEEISDCKQEDISLEDNGTYVQLWKRSSKSNDEKFDRLYNKSIDEGE